MLVLSLRIESLLTLQYIQYWITVEGIVAVEDLILQVDLSCMVESGSLVTPFVNLQILLQPS